MGYPKGIDVASYQSTTYGTSGLSFVVAKATESTSYVNPHYAGQIAHGRAAGLVIGHYHFQHHGSAQAQVDYFAKHADVRAGEFIALDWEAKGLTNADKDEWLRAAKLRFPHNKVILYTYTSMWHSVDTSGYVADGLWISDPNHAAGSPGIASPWVFHQYGIRGADLDVANFSSADALRLWASGTIEKVANMALSAAEIDAIAKAVWSYENEKAGDKHDMHQALVNAETNSARASAPVLTDAQAEAIAQRMVNLLAARMAA